MRIGLIGKDLRGNFTKDVYELFGIKNYDTEEMGFGELLTLIDSRQFNFINVTAPYTRGIAPYVDVLSDHAKAIGAVDAIIVKNGITYGYNTDYDSFKYMINHHEINLKDKKVLILGNGGTSAAVQYIAKEMGAKEIVVVDKIESLGSISYVDCFAKHLDSQILINTSPVGMSPDIDNAPIAIRLFKDLEAVIDVVYNPILTRLGLDAQENDVKRIIGIEMLVAQCKQSVEIMTGEKISNEKVDEVILTLLLDKCNIVLIGMPSAGKTTIGHMLTEKFDKKFIDMDDVVVADTGMAIPEIFANSGEKGFRQLESMTAYKLGKMNSVIIGTGGGTIKNKINMDYLRLNGVIVFIDRSLENLVTYDPNRPLSSSAEAVAKLHQERYPLYQKYSSAVVLNNDAIEETVDNIVKAFEDVCTKAVAK